MGATWRTLATLCRECDWSKLRLVQELQSGLQYRTIPPGHTIDWSDSSLQIDLAESTVTILPIRPADERIDQYGNVIEPRFPVTIGVEVRSPSDAPLVPEPSPPVDEVPAPLRTRQRLRQRRPGTSPRPSCGEPEGHREGPSAGHPSAGRRKHCTRSWRPVSVHRCCATASGKLSRRSRRNSSCRAADRAKARNKIFAEKSRLKFAVFFGPRICE